MKSPPPPSRPPAVQVSRRTFVQTAALLATGVACGPSDANSPIGPSPSPTPASPPASGFGILAVGDIGDCGTGGAETSAKIITALLSETPAGSRPTWLHTLGDHAYQVPDGLGGSKTALNSVSRPFMVSSRPSSSLRSGITNWTTLMPGALRPITTNTSAQRRPATAETATTAIWRRPGSSLS